LDLKRIDNKINIIPLEPKRKENGIGIIYSGGKTSVLVLKYEIHPNHAKCSLLISNKCQQSIPSANNCFANFP
jgi:hypothetical protein